MINTNKSTLSDLVTTSFQGIFYKDSKKGKKYVARFTVNKKTYTKVLGYEVEGITVQKASLLRLQLIHNIKYRILENRYEDFEFITLYDMYLYYRKPMISHNTYKNLKSHKTAYYEKIFKGKDVREVEYIFLQLFINKLLEQKKPATVEKIANGLKTFFRYLHEEGILTKNITSKIHLPKYDNKKYFILPSHKVKKLVNYIKSIEHKQYKAIFMFLLHGRRVSEVLNLKWEYIDIENNRYTIDYKYSKNRKTHYFSLEDFLIEAINKLDKKGIYLFENCRTKKPLTYTTVFRQMKLLKEECEIKKMTIHDFRHLIGYLGINNGYNLELIGAILGHSNIQSTQRYSFLTMKKTQRGYRELFKNYI